ncbi:hypothetical protein PT974_02436 [Cladobotryum mycophilum]|uniref:Transposase n=1 Tax=Cladobotryum mycophilum TaxID=491253 RepID=A0ABR0SYK7_9HYPO
MTRRKPKSDKRWSMYPDLHSQVLDLIAEENLDFQFYHDDTDQNCEKDYDTNIMGRFICHKADCLPIVYVFKAQKYQYAHEPAVKGKIALSASSSFLYRSLPNRSVTPPPSGSLVGHRSSRLAYPDIISAILLYLICYLLSS